MRPANDKHFNEPHEYVESNDNGLKRRGYQPSEYVHQEFPKLVSKDGQDEEGKKIRLEATVNSAKEEAAFFAEPESKSAE